MSEEKRELSEAEREQRRDAGRQGGLARAGEPLTEAELQQRRDAAANSTGPKTEEGKARSSRNAWRTGEHSAATKAKVWQELGLGKLARPCKSTCDKYPCSLVEEGLTSPGGDCMDHRVYVEAFDTIITTLQSGDATHAHGLLASVQAGAIDVLMKLRDEVAEKPLVLLPLVNKDGDVVGEKPISNPLLPHYIKLLGELGINLPELMATPRAVAKQNSDDDAVDAVSALFGRLANVPGIGRGRVIDGEVER